MRRKDRVMDKAFALEVIDEAPFGILSMTAEGEPYGLPLSLVRAGDRLLFHTAREGHKFDFIVNGAKAHVVFVSRVKVPEPYTLEELDELAQSKKGVTTLLSEVFTTEFASVMVEGELQEVTDPVGKKQALELICLKYTKDMMKYFDKAAESGLTMVRIFEISMDAVSAKRKMVT